MACKQKSIDFGADHDSDPGIFSTCIWDHF